MSDNEIYLLEKLTHVAEDVRELVRVLVRTSNNPRENIKHELFKKGSSDLAIVFYQKAERLIELGKDEKALECYEKALKCEEGGLQNRVFLIELYTSALDLYEKFDNRQKQIDVLTRMIKLEPNGNWYFKRSLLYYNLQNFEAALEDSKFALSHSCSNERAKNLRDECLEKLGK